MRIKRIFKLDDANDFKHKLVKWGCEYKHMAIFDSHNAVRDDSSKSDYNTYDFLAAIGSLREISPINDSFNALKLALDSSSDWWFGFLSYDLKNELENLVSENYDGLNMPNMHFFQAKWIFKIEHDVLELLYLRKNEALVDSVFAEILNTELDTKIQKINSNLKSRISKEEYIAKIKQVKNYISKGDIYELNFCQEFFMENIKINPLQVYNKLQKLSPTPYSCFYKLKDKYLMCSSPERFLKKQKDKLISQPIKGTAKRGISNEEDELIKQKLFRDPKERAENIMIVDLVRNDLAKTSEGGTVEVEELCGIYTFPQVHQMISTITSTIDKEIHYIDAIKQCFPMGSMTGAPKLRSMEIIEKLESTKRGLYSGAVGYIEPNGDFDFNVVIRSIQYNAENKYLSFMVGGAITMKSKAENEFEECILKSKAMRKVFDS